jgi:tetratricopeptide (TPR) repeat protein
MRRVLTLVALLAAACGGGSSTGRRAGGGVSSPPLSAAVAEGKALLEQGQADAALARLESAGQDPESLYYQGLAWAKKAETAPLPTPPPMESPLRRGVPPAPAPEFKPEELKAIACLEAATQARPEHAAAHLALADLLAPHALRRYQRVKEAANRKGKPEMVVLPETPVDVGVDRVARVYRAAVLADPSGREPVEKLIAFAVPAERLADAEHGYREMIGRVRERAEPFARYGDFLANLRKDPDAAIEQYRQALIWDAADEATRNKIAEIYLNRGIAHFERQQFAMAEAQLREAQKYVTDRESEQGRRLARYTARLREIRQPAVK